MAQPATILPFRSRSDETETHTGSAADIPSVRVRQSDVDVNFDDSSKVSIDDLYPAAEAATIELSIALGLLSKNIERADAAVSALQSNNQIDADSAMQQIHATLPELFNCRGLGDGFGETINALLAAFENSNGVPFNKQQAVVIRLVLSRLRSEPFIKFHSALDLVEKLEAASLFVEPKGLEYFLDWLDE